MELFLVIIHPLALSKEVHLKKHNVTKASFLTCKTLILVENRLTNLLRLKIQTFCRKAETIGVRDAEQKITLLTGCSTVTLS
jgi:hypothetical protein